MFVVVPRSDRLRASVEDQIRRLYWKRYDAVLASFARTIVAELDEAGDVECAAGLRLGQEELFSEAYLDLPVEQALKEHLMRTVSRSRIVEVCHLAGRGSGCSLPFVEKLIGLLRAMDTEWAIFTATRPLRSLLRRSGLTMIDLGQADRNRVADPAVWGSYFEHDPRIMAVGQGAPSVTRRFIPAFTATRAAADARIL